VAAIAVMLDVGHWHVTSSQFLSRLLVTNFVQRANVRNSDSGL